MKHYVFECYDEDEDSLTTVKFVTENDTWSGYNGPMWKFFDFLKGCGFVFEIDSEIGVMTQKRGFEKASDK